MEAELVMAAERNELAVVRICLLCMCSFLICLFTYWNVCNTISVLWGKFENRIQGHS